MKILKKMKEYDKRISFSMIRFYQYHTLNEIMKLISSCGDFGMSWLIIIFVTNLFENTRQMSIHMLFALIVATLVGQITIKSIVRRKRPCHTYQDVQILVPVPSDLSFPSGHTTSSFACSTVLFCYHPLLGLIGYTYAALTAISRVYLFVHYLSDVLSGMILGTTIGLIISLI